MRRVGYSAVFAFVAVVLTVLFSGVLDAASYSDPQGRFSFTVPDGWQAAPPPSGVTLPPGTQFAVAYVVPTLKTNNFQANVNIVTVTVPAGTPLSQFVSTGIAAVAQVPGYQAGTAGVQNVTLGGQPAALLQYTLAPSGQTLRLEQVVAYSGSTAYVITFTADPADFATLLQQGSTLLSTFAFAGASPAPATGPTTAVGSAPALPPAPVVTRVPTVVAPAPPRTGEGGGADYIRRLGDG